MKKMVMFTVMVLVILSAKEILAHQIYVKENPTNESGIEFGVDNASGFTHWRAYVRGLNNNSQGYNTNWNNAGNGWWYYDLNNISQRVMWNLDTIANQNFEITYWVFRSDGSWEYGTHVNVVSDQIQPMAWFFNMNNGQFIDQAYYNIQVTSSDNLSGVDLIRIYVVVPAGVFLPNWTPSGLPNQYYMEYDFAAFVHQFNFPVDGNYTFTLWVKDRAGNITYEPGGSVQVTVDSTPDPPPDPPPVDPPPADEQYADSFTYPMNCDKIYRLEPDNQIPVGACYDYQPYGSLFAFDYKIHLGADLNLRGLNDLGEPLYAIANGLVWDYGWTSGWGNYLILRIQSYPGQSFRLTDGTQVTEIYVLYAHVDEIRIIKDNGQVIEQVNIVKQETYVQKSWQIATIGDGNGNFSPHLHFEIRINGYSQLGFGYQLADNLSYLDYYVDPIEFIDNNWTLDNQTQLKVYVHAYDRNQARTVRVEFNPNHWRRQGRNYGGLPLSSVGWSNNVWLASSNIDQIAGWSFYVPVAGAWSVYTIIPRYYAQANNVQYRIWHSSQDAENPYYLRLDQANNDENVKVYLGTFNFYNNWRYSVDIFSLTSDNPAQNVALDTLVLVHEGDFGVGGGNDPLPTPIPDPSDNTDLNDTAQTITFDVNVHVSGNVNGSEFGCQFNSLKQEFSLTVLISLLIILMPFLVIFGRKLWQNN